VAKPNASRTYEIVHSHLLWWLLAAYALGAFWPGPGEWIRGALPDQLIPGDHHAGVLLKGMLAVLLFNAGLGIDLNAVKQIGRRLAMLFVVPVIGFVAPAIYLVVLSFLPSGSLSPELAYALLFGVAVVGAMPAAASSTGWAQTANGNMAISCGLVVTTTFFSPLGVWLMLGLARWIWGAAGFDAAILPSKETFSAFSYATAAVIAIWGLVPMGIGIAARQGVGNENYQRAKPYVKLITVAVILLLNYTNASISLPRLVSQPEWGTIGLILCVMVGLCVVQYSAAYPLIRLFRTDRSERMSLYFAMGMRNNGAGLVLIASCFDKSEVIILTVIMYTLIQHLAAGFMNRFQRESVEVTEET
jgi:BASS family bile acid:Na+ symporter